MNRLKQTQVWSYLLWGSYALTAAVLTASNSLGMQWLDRHTQALFFNLRGRVTPPPEIVILSIDDESLGAFQAYQDEPVMRSYLEPMQSFPWRRVTYARAIDQLMAAGAKVVTIDLLFDLPSSYGPQDDQQLAAVLAKHKDRVVLGAAYDESITPQGLTIALSTPNQTLNNTGVRSGFVNYLPLEADRRVYQLASEYREQIIRPQGIPVLDSLAEATLKAAQINYPAPRGPGIFYYGGERTFAYYPFTVLAPNQWNAYKERFRGKIVLIGTTAESLKDLLAMPFSPSMPGVEIHANSIATLLEGKSIAQISARERALLVLIIIGTSGLGLLWLTKQTVDRLLWSLGLSAAWLAISYAAFTWGRVILPAAMPSLGILLGGFSYFTLGVIQDRQEKQRFRSTLERYVAAPVVQEILKAPDDYHTLLKGRRIKAAVLFCDIRGFTTLSSQLDAEQLVEQLNVYLDGMVEAILAAGGTVDKFIGDAIMAEFGSPVSQGEKNDARNAVRAALGMRQALAQLRQHWRKNGQVPLFNGIGINYGELIAGDIGSWRRREYAVIGDAVNVASRVEGLTKQYHTDLLITESLYQLLADELEVVLVGEQEVKGRSGAIKLYSVVGFQGTNDRLLYTQVHQDFLQFQAKV